MNFYWQKSIICIGFSFGQYFSKFIDLKFIVFCTNMVILIKWGILEIAYSV